MEAGHVKKSEIIFDFRKKDVGFVLPLLILTPLLIWKEIVILTFHLIWLDEYSLIIPIKNPLSGVLLEFVTHG